MGNACDSHSFLWVYVENTEAPRPFVYSGSRYQFEFVLQLDKISNVLLVKAFGFIHVSAHFGLNFESAQ